MLILNKTNKKTLVLIILLTFLICFSINTVTGTNLKINITDVFQTKKLMDTDNYIENKNIYKFSSYTRNYGSITCKTRLRLEIHNNQIKDKRIIESIWGEPYLFHPGSEKYIDIYWMPNNITGNFTVCKKIYSCYDIIDKIYTEINIKDPVEYLKNESMLSLGYTQVNATTIKIDIIPKRNISEVFIKSRYCPLNSRLDFNNFLSLEEDKPTEFYMTFETEYIRDSINIELDFIDVVTKEYKPIILNIINYKQKELSFLEKNQIWLFLIVYILLIAKIIRQKNDSDTDKTKEQTTKRENKKRKRSKIINKS